MQTPHSPLCIKTSYLSPILSQTPLLVSPPDPVPIPSGLCLRVMDPSMNVIDQWGPQPQGEPIFLGDLGLDFDFDLENLGLPPPQTAISAALTQPIIHPTLTPQRTVGLPDGGYARPSASLPAGSSAAVINHRDLGLLFGNPNIPTGPIPMTSGVAPTMAPTPASLSSHIGVNPVTTILGSPSGAPMQIVRPWNAPADPLMDRANAAPASSADAGSRQAPAFHCACLQHGHPLVRVHRTVKWVRPDVMKMIVYFNFSPNAADEAHSSWECCDA